MKFHLRYLSRTRKPLVHARSQFQIQSDIDFHSFLSEIVFYFFAINFGSWKSDVTLKLFMVERHDLLTKHWHYPQTNPSRTCFFNIKNFSCSHSLGMMKVNTWNEWNWLTFVCDLFCNRSDSDFFLFLPLPSPLHFTWTSIRIARFSCDWHFLFLRNLVSWSLMRY